MDNKTVGGSSIPKCLPDSDIFGNISDVDLQALSDTGEWIVLTDEYLLLKGSPIEHIYYIYEGNVEIKKSGSDNEIIGLKSGDSIGEVSFLSRSIAQSDIQAVGRVIFWKISHESLFTFLSEHEGGAQICMNMAGDLASRLHDANGKIIELSDSINSYLASQNQRSKIKTQEQEKIRQLEKLLSETREARQIPQKKITKAVRVKKTRPAAKKFVAPKKKNNQTIAMLAFVLLMSLTINLNYFLKKSTFVEIEEEMTAEIADLTAKVSKLDNSLHKANHELKQRNQSKDTYETELNALRTGNLRLKNQLNEKKEELDKLVAEKSQMSFELEYLKQNNADLIKEIQAIRSGM